MCANCPFFFYSVTANRISGVPAVLCDDDDEFMDGMVGELTSNKCNAILCPPGFSSPVGRQTSVDVECERCAGGTAEAPYYGSLSCNAVSGEKKILEELYDLIFTGKFTFTRLYVDLVHYNLKQSYIILSCYTIDSQARPRTVTGRPINPSARGMVSRVTMMR